MVPHPVSPPAPALALGVGGVGSGLDEALAGGGFPPEPLMEKKDELDKEEKKKEVKSSVGRMLASRAERFEESTSSGHGRKKRKARARDERAERKKRSRGDGVGDTSSEDGESNDSSDAPFQKLSTRGEMDLWRQSQKNPGKLLKSGLQEMGRFLADRVGGNHMEGWEDRKVMAYINQVLLTQHPVQNLGVRNLREAQTLGAALDLLMSGNLGSLGDLLMQRLKALETAINEQSWGSARHQELIAPQAASLTNQGEKEAAARAELRSVKLRTALQKSKGGNK